jgi:hypothetical protein
VGILCTHVCQQTNAIHGNSSRNGGRGIKESGGGGEFNYDIL